MPDSKKEDVKDNNPSEVIQPANGQVAQNPQVQSGEAPTEQTRSSEDHNWKEVREIMQHQKQKIAELEERLEKNKKPEKAQEIEDPRRRVERHVVCGRRTRTWRRSRRHHRTAG